MSLEGKQLVISSNQTSGAPISFALTDAQFEKALTVFAPPPKTKPSLWQNKEYTKNLIKVAAYLDAVQYMRPNGSCFDSQIISNHFDNCMIQQFGGENDTVNDGKEFSFSIDEWFNDVRGDVPEELRNWDPQGVEPMPVIEQTVDWYGALTEQELHFNGFVDLFSNCIDLEELTAAEVAKRKHGAMTTFGDHPSQRTQMPDPINQRANFDNFTPSKLIGSTASAGMQFPSSGLLGR